MNSVITLSPTSGPDAVDLRDVDTTTLREMLTQQISITAEHVARMAAIWRELERRGEDLTQMRTGMGAYLSAVASGRLLPEAVVTLAGNRTALRAVSMLDPEEQARILRDGAIQVRRGEGQVEAVRLVHLSQADIYRAIDTVSGRVRPPAEQRDATRRRSSAPKSRIVITLTEQQHREILDKARRLNISGAEFVISALKNAGAI